MRSGKYAPNRAIAPTADRPRLERFAVAGRPREQREPIRSAALHQSVDAPGPHDLPERRPVELRCQDLHRPGQPQLPDAPAGFGLHEPRLVPFRQRPEGLEDHLVAAESAQGRDHAAARLRLAYLQAPQEGIAGGGRPHLAQGLRRCRLHGPVAVAHHRGLQRLDRFGPALLAQAAGGGLAPGDIVIVAQLQPEFANRLVEVQLFEDEVVRVEAAQVGFRGQREHERLVGAVDFDGE